RIFPPTAEWQRELLRDKRRLAEFVSARGIAVPEHRALTNDDALGSAIAALGVPLVVKGSTGRGGSTTHVVHSPSAAAEAMARVRRAGVACFAPLAAVLRGERPLPELGFRDGVERAVFPLALLAAESWRPRALGGALRGFRADRGVWRPWRQGRHLMHRLARVAHNWQVASDALFELHQ